VILVAVYDANVLYPSALRDVLIRVGDARLVQPKWTEDILDEVFESLARNRPDLDAAKLARTRALMNTAIEDVLVVDYARHIGSLTLPDPEDRHVLAAAIQAEASVIVTKNTRDFPNRLLGAWGITAQHPDDFLAALVDDAGSVLAGIIEQMAVAWRSPTATTHTVLDQLQADIPKTTEKLRQGFVSHT